MKRTRLPPADKQQQQQHLQDKLQVEGVAFVPGCLSLLHSPRAGHLSNVWGVAGDTP